MIEDIINSASNLVNTPGLLMVGVGVVSAMVLRKLVYDANYTSATLINYQNDSDEFPLPIPLSIYVDDRESGISRANRVRRNSVENAKYFGPTVNRPLSSANPTLIDLPKTENLVTTNLIPDAMNETPYHGKKSVVGIVTAYHDGCSKSSKNVSSNLPTSSKYEYVWERQMDENSSASAAGDTYLVVDPPEDSSEYDKDGFPFSPTEANSPDSKLISSFTGPLLISANGDESSSQSVTWTDAFVKREPFGDRTADVKPDESKSRKIKPKHQIS